MTNLVKQHLFWATDRMKKQADKFPSERSIQEGHCVLVKALSYVQSSVASRAHQKLAFKFFDPYLVLSRVGVVAYRVKLPASSSVDPVFHVP